MVKKRIQEKEISHRPAEPSDAGIAGRLLFDSFPKMAAFVIGLGNEKRAQAILTELFAKPGHRFSYEFGHVAIHQGKVVGLFIGYSGKRLGKLNRRLGRLMIRQYRFRGKAALLIRAWPLVFIKEVGRDEYLLSNLAVRKHLRNKGIGAGLLTKVEEEAREAGLRKISLMVSIGNRAARRFYERHGYHIRATHLESNKRVAYLGPGYHRMVKEMMG
jgi:ribosomal protein S18 acetylase RimI-like enzyme